jgi:uncharacterized membrane protein
MENGITLAIGHALLIGIVAGLRTMIAPTAVAYSRNSYLWMIFAVLAIAELIGDKLPKTPARTMPLSLVARCVAGGASAYFLVQGSLNGWLAALCGIAGALIGAYGGYGMRRLLTARAKIPDIAVALGEDILTIALAIVAIRV